MSAYLYLEDLRDTRRLNNTKYDVDVIFLLYCKGSLKEGSTEGRMCIFVLTRHTYFNILHNITFSVDSMPL